MDDEFFMKLISLPKSEQKILQHLFKVSGFSGVARQTQREVAASTGLDMRTVSKAYGRLKEAGVLATEGHGRVVFNPALLMRGNETSYPMKAKRFSEARGAREQVPEVVVRDNKEYLAAVLGTLPTVADTEDDASWGWPDDGDGDWPVNESQENA